MMNRQEKEVLVENMTSDIKKAKALVFSQYQGVTVKDLSTLRGELRKSGSKFRVFKKTLLDIALKKAGLDVDGRALEGQVGVAFGTDEVVAAKTIANFTKANKETSLAIIGGTLESKSLSEDEVKALAKLPSKDELRGMLVGTLQAPISGFVRALSGNLSGLMQVLKAVAEKKA